MNAWAPDKFLAGFESFTWVLDGAQLAEGEPEVPLTATLVRRPSPSRKRAVLYVHGWNDYFFQSHVAEFWESCGFDFYAVDLRRYGRNLVRGIFAGYITDLRDYDTELNDACRVIREEGHDQITVCGHSTGGLIVSLWASRTSEILNGVVLNSAWIDMQGPPMLRKTMLPLVSGISALSPTTPLQLTDSGLYWESISDQERGEWHIDRNYKSNEGFVIRFGWGRAIWRGQERIDEGISIPTPVLTMMSDKSDLSVRTWDDAIFSEDIVLDVERLAATAWKLGDRVTIVRIAGGMHDLALSPKPVRDHYFAETRRWLDAYVE